MDKELQVEATSMVQDTNGGLNAHTVIRLYFLSCFNKNNGSVQFIQSLVSSCNPMNSGLLLRSSSNSSAQLMIPSSSLSYAHSPNPSIRGSLFNESMPRVVKSIGVSTWCSNGLTKRWTGLEYSLGVFINTTVSILQQLEHKKNTAFPLPE